MAWLRASGLLGVLVMFLPWGCGGSSEHAHHGEDSGGSSGTSSTTASAGASGGASSSGGSSGVGGGGSGGGATTGGATTGGATTGSVTGSGAMAGVGGSTVSSSGVAAAGGASPGPSFTNEREEEILSPLWTDVGTLQTASGYELLELARAIALGRGYALCRCTGSPDGPPADVEAVFADCAIYEAQPYALGEPDNFRCMREFGEQVPELDEQIRCAAVGAVEEASRWLATCNDVGALPPLLEWPSDCSLTQDFIDLQELCHDAYYCPDGTFTTGFVTCDGYRACPDLSDELECFDIVGQDLIVCGDGTIVTANETCSSECEIPLTRDPCPEGSYTLSCPDGTQIYGYNLCDRRSDCPGGEDEAICLR